MTLRQHYEILNLAKISLDQIAAFSLASRDEEHAAIARRIQTEYGLPGLRTLWMCQGLDASTRGVSVMSPDTPGATRATRWWLTSQDDAASQIKDDFLAITDRDEANRLLGMCSRQPQFNLQSPESNTLFSPGDCEDTASLLHAVHVRRLAQTYFPHIPEVASPLNYLYTNCYEVADADKDDHEDPEKQWDPIYHDPIGAFVDDEHALKYFAMDNRPLPMNPPEWLLDFAKNGDTEWNVYKALGIPLEQAYVLAVCNAASPKVMLALPDNLDLPAAM